MIMSDRVCVSVSVVLNTTQTHIYAVDDRVLCMGMCIVACLLLMSLLAFWLTHSLCYGVHHLPCEYWYFAWVCVCECVIQFTTVASLAECIHCRSESVYASVLRQGSAC